MSRAGSLSKLIRSEELMSVAFSPVSLLITKTVSSGNLLPRELQTFLNY